MRDILNPYYMLICDYCHKKFIEQKKILSTDLFTHEAGENIPRLLTFCEDDCQSEYRLENFKKISINLLEYAPLVSEGSAVRTENEDLWKFENFSKLYTFLKRLDSLAMFHELLLSLSQDQKFVIRLRPDLSNLLTEFETLVSFLRRGLVDDFNADYLKNLLEGASSLLYGMLWRQTTIAGCSVRQLLKIDGSGEQFASQDCESTKNSSKDELTTRYFAFLLVWAVRQNHSSTRNPSKEHPHLFTEEIYNEAAAILGTNDCDVCKLKGSDSPVMIYNTVVTKEHILGRPRADKVIQVLFNSYNKKISIRLKMNINDEQIRSITYRDVKRKLKDHEMWQKMGLDQQRFDFCFSRTAVINTPADLCLDDAQVKEHEGKLELHLHLLISPTKMAVTSSKLNQLRVVRIENRKPNHNHQPGSVSLYFVVRSSMMMTSFFQVLESLKVLSCAPQTWYINQSMESRFPDHELIVNLPFVGKRSTPEDANWVRIPKQEFTMGKHLHPDHSTISKLPTRLFEEGDETKKSRSKDEAKILAQNRQQPGMQSLILSTPPQSSKQAIPEGNQANAVSTGTVEDWPADWPKQQDLGEMTTVWDDTCYNQLVCLLGQNLVDELEQRVVTGCYPAVWTLTFPSPDQTTVEILSTLVRTLTAEECFLLPPTKGKKEYIFGWRAILCERNGHIEVVTNTSECKSYQSVVGQLNKGSSLGFGEGQLDRLIGIVYERFQKG